MYDHVLENSYTCLIWSLLMSDQKWIYEINAEIVATEKKKEISMLAIFGQQNVTFFKVVFKIHFRPFWVILVKKFSGEKMGGGPILSHFLPIFGFWKFLQVFDIS